MSSQDRWKVKAATSSVHPPTDQFFMTDLIFIAPPLFSIPSFFPFVYHPLALFACHTSTWLHVCVCGKSARANASARTHTLRHTYTSTPVRGCVRVCGKCARAIASPRARTHALTLCVCVCACAGTVPLQLLVHVHAHTHTHASLCFCMCVCGKRARAVTSACARTHMRTHTQSITSLESWGARCAHIHTHSHCFDLSQYKDVNHLLPALLRQSRGMHVRHTRTHTGARAHWPARTIHQRPLPTSPPSLLPPSLHPSSIPPSPAAIPLFESNFMCQRGA